MSDHPVPNVSLGYVIFYVDDVDANLAFYERAFGLARRFFHEEAGKQYGELETGAARISFASTTLIRDQLGEEAEQALSGRGGPVEIALTTTDVPALYERATAAGAEAVKPPEQKPWGQTVAYVRDRNGFLVELCTPMP